VDNVVDVSIREDFPELAIDHNCVDKERYPRQVAGVAMLTIFCAASALKWALIFAAWWLHLLSPSHGSLRRGDQGEGIRSH